jgi:hypothetical protein
MRVWALIAWMFITLLLTISIVGLFLFIHIDTEYNIPSTWMTIDRSLINKVINE